MKDCEENIIPEEKIDTEYWNTQMILNQEIAKKELTLCSPEKKYNASLLLAFIDLVLSSKARLV